MLEQPQMTKQEVSTYLEKSQRQVSLSMEKMQFDPDEEPMEMMVKMMT